MTGSLRINVSGLQEKELDIPYIEDTSATKPKVRVVRTEGQGLHVVTSST